MQIFAASIYADSRIGINYFWHSYHSSASGAIYVVWLPYAPTAERISMKFQPLHERVVIRRADGRCQFQASLLCSDAEIAADTADFMTVKEADIIGALDAGEAVQRTA